MSRWPLCHRGIASSDGLASQFYRRRWCTLVSHRPGRSGWCQSVDVAPGTPAGPQRSGRRRYAADCSHGPDQCSEDLGKEDHGVKFHVDFQSFSKVKPIPTCIVVPFGVTLYRNSYFIDLLECQSLLKELKKEIHKRLLS